MIIETQIADTDLEGRPAPTVRARFFSQKAQCKYLRGLVRAWRTRLPMREQAVEIIRDAGVPPRNKPAQAKAIGEWVRSNVYYVNEPEETFQTPLRTLQSRLGDCDDMAVLVATLLEAIGIPSQLVSIGVDSGNRLTHIFPRAVVAFRGRIVTLPLDATIPHPMGTDPVRLMRSRGKTVKGIVV